MISFLVKFVKPKGIRKQFLLCAKRLINKTEEFDPKRANGVWQKDSKNPKSLLQNERKATKGFLSPGCKAFKSFCFSDFKVSMEVALISAERKADIGLRSC